MYDENWRFRDELRGIQATLWICQAFNLGIYLCPAVNKEESKGLVFLQSSHAFPLKDCWAFSATGEWGTPHSLSWSSAGYSPGFLAWPGWIALFCSSHGFAGFSPKFLRLFAFPRTTAVTSVLLSCTFYHSLLVVISIHTQYKTQHLVPWTLCDPKGRTSDFVCDCFSFLLKTVVSFHSPGPKDTLPRECILAPGSQGQNRFMDFFTCWFILIIGLSGLIFLCIWLWPSALPNSQRSSYLLESWIPAHTFLGRAVSTSPVVFGDET